jgi:organic radical activating enzyme
MSKTFCSYPWRHLYVQTTGHQKLCCLSNEHITKDDGYHQFNLSRDSLLETWNSNYMKNVRKKMLNNEKLSVCQRCYDLEAKGMKSMRISDDEEYYRSRTVDGVTDLSINHLELHFGNICNLACKMCSQQFSHKIGEELLKMGAIDPDFLRWVKKESGVVNNWTGELDAVYNWFKNEKIKKEIFNLISNHVHGLSIVGGEPTAIPEFYELLEYCYQKDTLKNKSINLTTNLTNTNKNLTQWLNKIKSIVVYGSIDGIGERNEYIRYPSKWNKILESLFFYQDLIKKTPNGKLVFGPTIQLLNIDHLADITVFFEQFAEKHKILSDIWWTSVVVAPMIYNYQIAPNDYKNYVIEELSTKINSVSIEKNKKQILSHITNLKNTLNEEPNNHLLNAFIKFNDFQDNYRKSKSWRTLLPQLEKSLVHTTSIKTIL